MPGHFSIDACETGRMAEASKSELSQNCWNCYCHCQSPWHHCQSRCPWPAVEMQSGCNMTSLHLQQLEMGTFFSFFSFWSPGAGASFSWGLGLPLPLHEAKAHNSGESELKRTEKWKADYADWKGQDLEKQKLPCKVAKRLGLGFSLCSAFAFRLCLFRLWFCLPSFAIGDFQIQVRCISLHVPTEAIICESRSD